VSRPFSAKADIPKNLGSEGYFSFSDYLPSSAVMIQVRLFAGFALRSSSLTSRLQPERLFSTFEMVGAATVTST